MDLIWSDLICKGKEILCFLSIEVDDGEDSNDNELMGSIIPNFGDIRSYIETESPRSSQPSSCHSKKENCGQYF